MVLKIDMVEVTSSAHCNTPEKAEVLLAVMGKISIDFQSLCVESWIVCLPALGT